VKLFYIQNTGAAWGILAGQQFVFYIITAFGVSAILYLMFQERGKSKFALTTYSLLLAGALGNFIDRVRLGFVVDMFQLEFIDFPIFNIADICLTVGVAALFLYILIVERKKEKSGK
jgi:signal peptidase II